jgi:ankyrin repeat protein
LDTIKEALTSEYSTEIINCSDESFQDKKTCLMLASENGRTDVVKHLLASKANCNLFDNWGYTALMLAAQMDRADIVGKSVDN